MGASGLRSSCPRMARKLVLVAIRLQELPGQRLRFPPRRHRVRDLDGVDHHIVRLPGRALGWLGDEIEEPLGRPGRQTPQPRILVAEERVAGPVDSFQEVPGRACRRFRDRLPPRTSHQVLLSHQLLEPGVGQHEHLFRAAHDCDGGRRLHEQRIEMFAVRVGFRSRHPLPALEFVALPLLLRDFMPEELVPAVVLEKDLRLGEHGLGREGLDDVVDRAVGVALEDLLLLAADRGDEDDGCVAGALPLADQRRRLEPVELRHLHVEEDERAILLEEEAQRFPTRARLDQALVQRFEDCFQRQEIRLAIVDDEDRRGLVGHVPYVTGADHLVAVFLSRSVFGRTHGPSLFAQRRARRRPGRRP